MEESKEGNSSASAVAIDNKIEQAMVSLDSLNTQLRQNSESNAPLENKVAQSMDLVKSHLMYAVREEVEVLKEVIKELMERMHKVEQENKVLRSEATPETLSRLPPPLPPVQKPLLQQLMVSLNSSSLPPSSSS